MTFEEIVDQAIKMVRRRGQVSYRMLKRQFALDDAGFEDLKDELLYSQSQIIDDEGRGFAWTGHIPAYLVVRRFSRVLIASRSQDLQV
jgi:hypothetical protein